MTQQFSSEIHEDICFLRAGILGISVLPSWSIEWAYQEPYAPSEVSLMFPQGGAAESPQYHLFIHVVYGVLGREIIKQTTVCTNNLVCTGLNLLPSTGHYPRPDVLCQWYVSL